MITSRPKPRDYQHLIGPAILAVVVAYLAGVWGVTSLVKGWVGEDWNWLPPLLMFMLVIPGPAFGLLILIATADKGFMTPKGYWRWLRSIEWGSSSNDSSGSGGSSSWDSDSGSDSTYSGGGSFGGGGGGASW